MPAARFKVTIPCKPYVRRYVELLYGQPADLRECQDLYKLFRNAMQKPSTRRNNQYENQSLSTYSSFIEIYISQDDFYRYGWEMSLTNVVSFNKTIESTVKAFMLLSVAVYHSMGLSYHESIKRFQENFNMGEIHWPFESIKKYFYRNAPAEKFHMKHLLLEQTDDYLQSLFKKKKFYVPLPQ